MLETSRTTAADAVLEEDDEAEAVADALPPLPNPPPPPPDPERDDEWSLASVNSPRAAT